MRNLTKEEQNPPGESRRKQKLIFHSYFFNKIEMFFRSMRLDITPHYRPNMNETLNDEMLNDYIVICNQVFHVTPNSTSLSPIRLFQKKNANIPIYKMHHITFGSKKTDHSVAFDLLEGRTTIDIVLNHAHTLALNNLNN